MCRLPDLPLHVFFIHADPPSPVLHGPFTGVVFCFRIFFTDHTICYILNQSCIIMLIRAEAVRQFIMEPPTLITRAFQPPDQVPLFIPSRNFMHTVPAVPVFQGTPTAWTDVFFFTVY